MQPSSPLDSVEFALEPSDPFADQPSVDLELALAGSAEKTKTAALALKMSPRPDQPRALVGERGQLDLQPALMGMRPRAKNFKDQTGAVNNLRLPAPFEIALLHWAEHAIEDNYADRVFADQPAEVFEGPTPKEVTRPRTTDPRDLGTDDIEADCPRETNRFLQSSLDQTARCRCRLLTGGRFQCRMDDEGATRRGTVRAGSCIGAAQDSAISLLGSNSWIGCPGITVEIACLYTS